MLTVILCAIGTCVAALALTPYVRRYAIRRQLLDIPNARSSHDLPTPRAGGIAIVLPTIVALVALAGFGFLPWRDVIAVCGAGGALALIGFLDDRSPVPVAWRLAGHLAAAVWVLWWLGGPPLERWWPGGWAWAAYLIAIGYIVALINLTNFMDGIDGIAAMQAAIVCGAAAVVAHAAVAPISVYLPPLIVAAAAVGFLVWNWPPAKIFMGDTGSGFLGVTIATLSLIAARAGPQLFLAWIVLNAAFITDAGVTLARRLARGEPVYRAHRMHAYQHAARRWTHRPVTITFAVINVVWLLPIAALIGFWHVNPWAAVAGAYAPLIAMALWFRAGSTV